MENGHASIRRAQAVRIPGLTGGILRDGKRMGAICGWFTREGDTANESDLGAMGRAAVSEAPDVLWTTHLPHQALAARGGDLQRTGTLLAAIEGHPRWRDAELARLARDQGPAAALLEAYRRHADGLVEHLTGDFALAVLDGERRHALLAIDRLGIRPLAFAADARGLVFGSQIASIITHPAIDVRGRPQALFDYLYFHMVPSPETFFEGIEKLRPGEMLSYQDGRAERRFYWHLDFSESRRPEKALAAELHEHLRRGVDACRGEPTTTGAFLSGGLDSSTVVGVLQGLQDQPADAYAIGFEAEGFDEMEYARATADHFGARLHQYYVTPRDVLDAIPRVARAYDEPFGNASAIPAYYCARQAREDGKTLLLAGDGGDEIFAGNARYAKQKLFALYDRVPSLLKSLVIEPLAFHLPGLGKVRSYIEQAKVPMPERLETYNFLHRFALEEIFAPEFLAQVDTEMPLELQHQRWARCGEASLVKRMLCLDHKFTLADNDLRKVNRMCELAGIEVRYPLLQEELVEFAAGIPSDLLLKGQHLRHFYRRAMRGFLAEKTLEKHKHGFGLPFGLWMKDYAPLKAFAHQRLEEAKARGYLNDAFISRIIEAHETGHATYYGVFIWVLVMLEEWMQAHGQ